MVNKMNEEVEYLKNTFKGNEDFILREINIPKGEKLYVVFFESLCNSLAIYNFVMKNVDNYLVFHKKIKRIEDALGSPKLIKVPSSESIFYFLENGFCVIFYKNQKYAVEVKAEIDRGITIAQTEPNMYGPKDSFCENYQKNLGVLKRRIKNKNLKTENIDQGIYTKTRVSILYIEDLVDKGKLEKIKNQLNKNSDKEIIDSFDMTSILKKNKVFPTILKTEKPSFAAQFLLKGYVVILVDNTPFVLVMDAKLDDFISYSTTDKFVKILRYICFFITVLTPGLYIALINFNPEIIPIKLLINFAEQRASVPFPALIEALLMLLTTEILREADIRFPNSYGSAASILGALILGEAAVNAGFVSPIMIIVVALTFITNLIFTEIKLVSAIRIMRISFLLIASFLGLYGLSIALITCFTIIANVKMYEGVYL